MGFRHHVSHERIQLHLAEGAAGTFIREDFLQAHNVLGQLGDLLLRRVDEREALHHVGEGCRGLLEALGEALVDLPADLLQAVVGIFCQRIDTLADFGV